FAGVVTQIHPETKTTFKVGDRVFGSTQGTYAEKLVCEPKSLLAVPPNLSFEQASGLFVTYPTSYAALKDRAGLKKGEWCLIHAAAGGNGADYGVNYREKDWAAQVLKITEGKGVDVVYDPVGLINESLRCVAWSGRILVVGFAAGTIEKIAANRILLKNVSIVGVFWGSYGKYDVATVARVWKELLVLFAEGKLVPVVYEKLYQGLDSVKTGLNDLAARKTFGKAVVVIGGAGATSKL
ncbi:hypothetical protein BGX21_010244, partial [Mortierella sp. AD011]